MDLAALQIVLRSADLGSFAAAAREAGVDASSASRSVAAIEDRVGIRIFQRSTRKLSLTDEGEAYLRRIAPLVSELEDARQEARRGRVTPTGRIRMTSSVAYGISKIVPQLEHLHTAAPELEIELILSDANLDMVAERVDLAVRLAPAPEGDLISSKLHQTCYRVVASPEWLNRNPTPISPVSLAEIDCLRLTVAGHDNTWIFRETGRREVESVAISGKLLMSNALAVFDAAKAGLGPALLADWLIADALRSGALIDVFPHHDATATSFDTSAWLLYPSRTYLPAKVRTVIDEMRRFS